MCVEQNYKNHQIAFLSAFMFFRYIFPKLLFLLLGSPATIIYCGRDVFLSSELQQLPASSTKHLKHIFFRGPRVEPLTKHTEIKMSEEKILLVFVANAFFKFTSFRKSFFEGAMYGQHFAAISWKRARNREGRAERIHTTIGWRGETSKHIFFSSPKCAVSHSLRFSFFSPLLACHQHCRKAKSDGKKV